MATNTCDNIFSDPNPKRLDDLEKYQKWLSKMGKTMVKVNALIDKWDNRPEKHEQNMHKNYPQQICLESGYLTVTVLVRPPV